MPGVVSLQRLQHHVTPYRLAVVGLLVLLAAVVALNGLGHFYTDTKPEVYLAPTRALQQSLGSWISSPFLGSPSFNVGYLPVLVVTSALHGLGLSPEWIYKVLHFVLWALTAWGVSRLTRRIVPRAGRWTGLVAAALVLLNPYTVQAGGTLPVALPMALLPWSLLAFVQALRHPGDGPWWHWSRWCWPAAFAMTFFAMSGMNAAVVPMFQLLALLPIVWVAMREWSVHGWTVGAVLIRCGLLVALVSAYWLVPAVWAVTTGEQIVSASESLTDIASVSSFTEVLRGLGLWPLYGRDSRGPWVPQDTLYITSIPVMLITMLWCALALLGLRYVRGAVREALALTIAIAAVVMVGMFPAQDDSASPFGVLLGHLLQLPGLSAFRTTNKIGAMLVVGITIALAVGAVTVTRSLARRSGVAPFAAGAAVMVLLVWAAPAFTGKLYTSQMDIPNYWRQAAKSVDAADAQSAVLMLPGQTQSDYRWTATRPDDVANSLFTRQVVLPETTPNSSTPGANFLQALDGTVQSGVVPAGTISTFARYLGASTVLTRHDTVWEDFGGARPAVIEQETQDDPGLVGAGNYGAPGQYVLSNTQPVVGSEVTLSPLQRYSVTGAQTTVRATATNGSLIVAGDGWAVPSMVSAGMLTKTPTFRYAQDLTASELATALRSGQAMVLTDTNQRRTAITTRLSNNRGPLLAANQTLGSSRVLGTDTDDQTVLQSTGPKVTATSEGSIFFELPYAVPQNALDDDTTSAWMFGDFDTAVGQRLTITEPTKQTLHTIRIKQASVGGTKIDKVTVQAGGKSVSTTLPDSGYGSVDLGGVTAGKVTVTVDSVRGSGYNMVGIADIEMPGGRSQRVARLPQTLTDRYRQLSAAERVVFDRTPLNILMRRDQGTNSGSDSPENELERAFSLPDSRTYAATAAVRVDGSMEAAYDAVAGYSTATQARSSSYYFSVAGNRASSAADGNSTSGWVPGGNLNGAWWQLKTGERDISSVTVDQTATQGASSSQRWADKVTISVDGRNVATGTLRHDGKTTIKFPSVRGSTVRMTVNSSSGTSNGRPPRFTTIDTGARMTKQSGAANSSKGQCIQVGTLDGEPLKMRPTSSTLADADSQGTTWQTCSQVKLGAGNHVVGSAAGFTLDSLNLKDSQTSSNSGEVPAVGTRVVSSTATHKSLDVRSEGAFAVVLGQSYNADWTATANGKDLGEPQLIDGYSTGWYLPSGGTYRIELNYAPQRAADVALWLSLATLLVCAVVAGYGLVRRQLGYALPGGGKAGPSVATSVPAAAAPDTDRDRGSTAAAPAQRRPSPVRRLLGRGWLRQRITREVALLLVAGFFVGWGGLVAAAVVIAVQRYLPLRGWTWQCIGAGLLMVAMVVYLLVLGDLRGQVDASGVSRSLWPHNLAGAALVIALLGAILGDRRGLYGPGRRHLRRLMRRTKDEDGD